MARLLYKYTNFDAAMKIVRGHKLKWSCPLEFNDPYDSQLNIFHGVDNGGLREPFIDLCVDLVLDRVTPPYWRPETVAALRSRLPRNLGVSELRAWVQANAADAAKVSPERMAATHKRMRRLAAHLRVLCLTEVHDSLVMWAHYANEHTGAVFAIRPGSGWRTGPHRPYPVVYCGEYPTIICPKAYIRYAFGVADLRFEHGRDAMLFKSSHWEYEKEWRCVEAYDVEPAPLRLKPISPAEIEAVYLGLRMTDENRAELMSLIRAQLPHARVLSAATCDDRFGLRFVST